MDKIVQLLGIPISSLTAGEVIAKIKSFLHECAQHHVATPNNEMLVEASKNKEFREVLQKTNLNLADSTGLKFAARWTGQGRLQRVTGSDTVTRLCQELGGDTPVFLLGAGPGIAQAAAQKLKERNPNLCIAGTLASDPSDESAEGIVETINAQEPHLLLVAYGAPAQDLWINKHLKELKTVRVAMGIGGTFDFLAGAKKRAPAIFRNLGLEWLWRLIIEPKRLPRIINAVVVFPYLVMRYGKGAP